MSKGEPPETSVTGQPLALIAGPTASGKSDLAVTLAQKIEASGWRAVVINADSAQVYADLQVLSARPTKDEMGGIEHRLFGAWDGATACSAADWAAAAKGEISAIHAEAAVPILCGGTGLYLRTLLDGIADIPPIDPEVRETVRSLHTADAHAALREEDPDRAARLSPNDTQRIARALEVVRSTGRTLAQWQASTTGGIGNEVELHPLVMLPDREWIYRRSDRRFEIMMQAGAVEEVRALLARDLDPALPVMRAIGVPEIAALLQGEVSLAEAIVAGQTATRRYAKRQYTWFRNQTASGWQRQDNFRDAVQDIFVSLFRDSA